MKKILAFALCVFATTNGISVEEITSSNLSATAEIPSQFHKLGNHILAEMQECTGELNDCPQLETCLQEAATEAGATVLSIKSHKFEPYGMTGVAVLSESHISVHTWPEYNYVAVDIFTCGQHVDVYKAYEILKELFKPGSASIVQVDRGFTN